MGRPKSVVDKAIDKKVRSPEFRKLWNDGIIKLNKHLDKQKEKN